MIVAIAVVVVTAVRHLTFNLVTNMKNITPSKYKLPRGNCQNSFGRKVIIPDMPSDITVGSEDTVIAYDSENYATFVSLGVAAEYASVSKQLLSQVVNGHRPTAHGYFWRFLKT